jgi:2-succinyl-5-enolpyruvyl-6-hydroxy-3-cyclohexene-1-carboxylate synthase
MVGDLRERESGVTRRCIAWSHALVYCEAASGLRDSTAFHDRLVRCGDATLRHLPVQEVWRFGSVPSVRFWRDLESREDVRVEAVTQTGRSGLARLRRTIPSIKKWPTLGKPVPAVDFLARDAALYERLGALIDRYSASEPALFRRLSVVIPCGAAVFTGNSLPVREWNLCAVYGRGHRVHVLRGVNGIDGNLSAFLGCAADEEESWCITGDLTTLYDLNAPWMLKQLPERRRQFVVIHNGGGRIFSRLPSLQGLHPWERNLMANPHNISLRGWAEMWGMGYVCGGAEVLDNTAALPDHAVIELHPDADQTEAFWQAWAEAEREVWG